MSLVAELFERETRGGRPFAFRQSNLARRDHVQRLQHSLTLKVVQGHNGCVNTLHWNEAGTKLLSGSDDLHLMLWSEGGRLLKGVLTGHTNNVFSALFLPTASSPDDRLAVSAAGDGLVLLHDLEYAASAGRGDTSATVSRAQQRPSEPLHQWDCQSRVKRMAVASAHPRLFWSASEDGVLRQFDVRMKSVERLLDFSSSPPTTTTRVQLKSLAINQAHPEMLAVAMNDSMVPVYDRRNTRQPLLRLLPAHLAFSEPDPSSPSAESDRSAGRAFSLHRSSLVTHLAFNSRGDELLANIGSEQIYVFNVDPSQNRSPDVFNALRGFLGHGHDNEAEEEKGRASNASVRRRKSSIFREVLAASEEYAREKELTRAIDLCSSAYSLYRRNNGVPFTLVGDGPQSATEVVGDLPKLLTSRASYYLERQWDGDSYTALRDLLHAYQLSTPKTSQCARIHLHLYRALAKLKQFELAAKCGELYAKRYRTAEDVERFKAVEVDVAVNARTSRSWTTPSGYVDFVDRFCGHCNSNTDIKEANWFGGNDELIMAGSDCGNLFVWERESGKVVKLIKADHYTVNCVQPHPSRFLVASSGIEDVVRFYEPALTSFKSFGGGGGVGDTEDDQERDVSSKAYEVMDGNNRRTNDNVLLDHLNRWGNFVFSIGLDVPPAPPSDDNAEGEGEGPSAEGTVRCRTM